METKGNGSGSAVAPTNEYESKISDSSPHQKIPDSSPHEKISDSSPHEKISDSSPHEKISDSSPHRPLKPDRGSRPIGGYCGPVASEVVRQAFRDRQVDLYWRHNRRDWLDSDDESNVLSPDATAKPSLDDSSAIDDVAPELELDLEPEQGRPNLSERIVRPRPILSLAPIVAKKSRPQAEASPPVFGEAESDREDEIDLLFDVSDTELEGDE